MASHWRLAMALASDLEHFPADSRLNRLFAIVPDNAEELRIFAPATVFQ